MKRPSPHTAALLTAACLFGSVQAAVAQGPFLPENDVPWSYVAPPIPAHCLQTYRLFLPQAPLVMPESGWPVVLHLSYVGYRRSEDTPALAPDSLLGKFLGAGIAVVAARATPSIETTDPLWETWCGSAPDIPGHGLFHPPGVVPPDLAAQGIAPYDTPEYHMPEKDAVMLLQHVRYMARQTGPFTTDQGLSMARLDHQRIAVHGTSAGAMVWMWAALGPDRGDEAPFAGLGGQYDEPTRPQLAILDRGVTWWPAFDGSLSPPTPHFGLGGHSEIPAPTIGDSEPLELLAASALWYEDAAANQSLPTYLSYQDPSVMESYVKTFGSCGPYPFCFDGQGTEGLLGGSMNLHPAWSGYAWSQQHPTAPVRLVIQGAEAYAQKGSAPAVPLIGDPLTQSPDQIQAMHDDDVVAWTAVEMEALLQVGPAESWTDLGGALAGSLGPPRLDGSGLLVEGAPVSLELSDALPGAQVVAIAGFSEAGAPLLGGTLVPAPDLVLLHAATVDASGEATLSATWPPGLPGGAEVYFQFWIQDPAAPEGYSASNGLRADVPL